MEDAGGVRYTASMSTLAEIEAAVDQLPVVEQRALFQFIAERINRSEDLVDDPVTAIIGAFPSEGPNDTARHDEDILYGHDESE